MKKILIADDEPDIVKVVKFRLVKMGFEVITAVDGKEALECVLTAKPDLVLLDYSMPFMNGGEVCQKIRQNSEVKATPVIIMTASTKTIADEQHLIEANDKILKPFDPNELIAKIEKILGDPKKGP